MSWAIPVGIGLVMGLMFAWPVLGLTTSFRLFNFPDLTIEGSVAIGPATLAVALTAGASPAAALAMAAIAGAALGAATAFIHTRLRVNKFLAGIIVVAMSYTICLRVMGAPNIGLLATRSIFDVASPLDNAAPGAQLGSALLLLILLICLVVGLRFVAVSPWGLRLRAVGSNPEYAEAIGISCEWHLVSGLALTNALAAVGGALIAMHQGFADVGMGQGSLILALASMAIGERLIPQRSLTMPTFVIAAGVTGALVYQVLVALALRFGLAAVDLKLATALFVLAVVAIQIRRREQTYLEAVG